MLKPLIEFVCDHCGDLIESPEKAYLEWLNVKDESDRSRATEFKIVHHDGNEGIFWAVRDTATKHLKDFVGVNGIGSLLTFIDPGEIVERTYSIPRALNLREFTEIVRRLTVPYYEEGRQYLQIALEDGYISTNQYGIFIPENLRGYIEKYGAASGD